MAALLGNMQNRGPQPWAPQGNYGGGLQQPMMGGSLGNYGGPQQPMRAFNPTGQPIPPGGAGYPQQPMMGGPLGNFGGGPQQPMPTGNVYNQPGQTPYQFGGGGSPQQPMQGAGPGGPRQAMPGVPSFGAPAGGAGAKGAGQNPQLKQAIAQLPGGPPMGGAMGPMRRQPGQGMVPQNPMLRR